MSVACVLGITHNLCAFPVTAHVCVWKQIGWNDASVAASVRQTTVCVCVCACVCVCVCVCVQLTAQWDHNITWHINPNFAHRVHSAYWWSCPWDTGDTVPFIPNLGTRRKWMASFTSRPFYLWGNGARYRPSLSRHFRERQFIASFGNRTTISQFSSPWPGHCAAFPAAVCELQDEQFLFNFPITTPESVSHLEFAVPKLFVFFQTFPLQWSRAAYSLRQVAIFLMRQSEVAL